MREGGLSLRLRLPLLARRRDWPAARPWRTTPCASAAMVGTPLLPSVLLPSSLHL
jgi:hypothetical protein